MWTILLGALGTIVNGAITAYNKSKDVTIAAIQASVGLASAAVQGMSLWIGHPFSPPALLAYSVGFYYAKAISYDNVISFWITGHAGYTPPLTPETAAVAGVVIAGMFGSGIANIIKR